MQAPDQPAPGWTVVPRRQPTRIVDGRRKAATRTRSTSSATTLFTLTMAALMIPGSKLTEIWGRKRCFVLGLAVYRAGGLLAARRRASRC